MLRSILFIAVTFAGCAVEAERAAPVIGTTTVDPSPRRDGLERLGPWRPALLPARTPSAAGPSSLGALRDLVPDPSRGAALTAAIDALPPGRQALGIRGITLDAILADPTLCERPLLRTTFSDGGEDYEFAATVPGWVWGLSDVTPDLREMPAACAASLPAAGDCTAEDRETFLPAGSACAACLQADGDWDGCLAEAACTSPAPARYQRFSELTSQQVWLWGARMTTLACAPDVEDEILLLSRDPITGERPYDVTAWEGYCFANWSDDEGAPVWACNMASSAGHALAEGAFGLTAWLRPAGSDARPMENRTFFVSDAAFADGRRARWSLLIDGGLGSLVAPVNTPYGWGLAPTTDPADDPVTADLEQRRLVAAMMVKTASAHDGVVVHPFYENRCLRWTELDDGTSRCDDVGPWTGSGFDDGFVSWWNQATGSTYVFPYTTLASTGLPDPAMPGGILTRVLGSTTLADPGWEGCAWPETFVPDRIPLLDTEPAGGVKQATFDGQTFRFGRPDAPDVVLAIATSQRRDYCPAPLP